VSTFTGWDRLRDVRRSIEECEGQFERQLKPLYDARDEIIVEMTAAGMSTVEINRHWGITPKASDPGA